jgi:hypothetical protein
MQRAINAGAVCIRIERDQMCDGEEVDNRYKIRARPLKAGEIFVHVPRGTLAKRFQPMLIEGSSQLLKAFVGAIQLALATLQLVSATDSQVAAYGYGAFIYTIIPYAFGSVLNVTGALMTNSYNDLTEMRLAHVPVDSGSPAAAPLSEDIEQWRTVLTSHGYDVFKRSHEDDDEPEYRRKVSVRMEPESKPPLGILCIIEVALYLGILGGLTHFRPGISKPVERGFFVSWVVIGIVGFYLTTILSDSRSVRIFDADERNPRRQSSKENNESLFSDSGSIQTNDAEKWNLLRRVLKENTNSIITTIIGVASLGGITLLWILQYIHLFKC